MGDSIVPPRSRNTQAHYVRWIHQNLAESHSRCRVATVRYVELDFSSDDKDSARREKYQIYLSISEPQPIFRAREASTKVVQGERNTKSQRAKVVEKFTFLLLSEAEIQQG